MSDNVQSKEQKILFVITKANFGGAQKYVYEISTDLKTRGYDVVVIYGKDGLLREKLDESGIRTIQIKSMQRNINPFSEFKTAMALHKIFRKENADIIHLNSSKAAAIGAWAGRCANIFNKKKSRIIFTIHGWAFNENRNLISKIFIKDIYWWTIALSHKSIAVSKVTHDQLKQISFSSVLRNKVVVIKNAIRDIDFVDRQSAREYISEKTTEISENTHIIGALAELHLIKGLRYLIEATKILIESNPNIITVIFGEGDLRKGLEKQIKDSGLENNVFLLGFVPNASQYMKGIDVYVSSSLSEGLSLVLLEARKAGIPIIATNVGGNPEALENYNPGILIKEKDPKAISSAVDIALRQPNTENIQSDDDFNKMIGSTIGTYSSN